METVSLNSIIILVSVVLGLYGMLLAAILGILSALWLRMGSLQQEFGELKATSREQISSVREEVNSVRKEVNALEERMERNHNQLMRAILAHSHRPDGRPTFDLPPDFEPTPADN